MDVKELSSKLIRGGPQKYHQKNTLAHKLFARDRIDGLVDPNSEWVEEGLLANCQDEDYPCDGIITGWGYIHGQAVGLIANDSTVKAGSWGRLTVEKIIRMQELALKRKLPLIYLLDSAGARITDQMRMFPGKRGAGRIFYNQVQMKRQDLAQYCIVFGPCAAGSAYIPAFCDLTIMVKEKASMYLGSPRMAQVVIGEQVNHEDMGGTQIHMSMSGSAHIAVNTEQEALHDLRKWMVLWVNRHGKVPFSAPVPSLSLKELIPEQATAGYDVRDVIRVIADSESFIEIHTDYAREIVCGLATLSGRVVGIVANQPSVKGGVIFCESAYKAARFVRYCDRQEIPLLFLCDVPGFMIGSAVEKKGIIRMGAELIEAVSLASVPKVSLILRKAYGAGLYAMCGPAFNPDCCLALPGAQIAVMGPEPAVQAVYHHHLEAIQGDDARQHFITEKTDEYLSNMAITQLASELVVDAVVDFAHVRSELANRFDMYCF